MEEMTEYFRETDMEFSRSVVTESAQIMLARQYGVVDRQNLIGLCLPRQCPSHFLNPSRAQSIQNLRGPNEVRDRTRKARNKTCFVVKLDANSRLIVHQLGRAPVISN